VEVDVPHPDLAELLQAGAGVQEQAQDGGVAPLLEPPALAGLEQAPQRLVVEDRDRVLLK
jgi:hypothetical protein